MKTPIKNKLVSTLLLGMCLTRCSDATPPSQFAGHGPTLVDDCTLPPHQDTLRTKCSNNRVVEDSCAHSWELDWDSTWKYVQGFGDTYNDDGLVLPDDALDSLLDACANCQSVRVYFGFEMIDSDSVLNLMLVNVDNSCNDVYVNTKVPSQSAILYINSVDSSTRWISEDQARSFAVGWSGLFNTEASFGTFKLINAYNYTRETIELLIQNPDRSVQADIAIHQVPKGEGWFDLPAAARIHDVLLTTVDDGLHPQSPTMDFAMPCPRFCGTVNLLTPPK